MQETIQGRIDHITYYNRENGYTIARVMLDGQHDPITAVGPLCSPMPGEILSLEGEWVTHRVYGRQFKVSGFSPVAPATREGIARYLASGMIKGIGEEMAGRIVERFGDKTLDILEYDIERLREVAGIGSKRIAMIAQSWRDTREIRAVMIFLQGCGVSPVYAARIYKHYGNDVVHLVQENPYRLAMDIDGIGFLTADKIASQLGFESASPARCQAGILYMLHRLTLEGHVFYPLSELLDKSVELLDAGREVIEAALGDLVAEGKVVIDRTSEREEAGREGPAGPEEDRGLKGAAGREGDPDRVGPGAAPGAGGPAGAEGPGVYLTGHYVCESGVAQRLVRLIDTPKGMLIRNATAEIDRAQRRLALDLGADQRRAVACALENGVCVITGGPGTGKTTITSCILQVCCRQDLQVLLAAPTGRAAKRLGETNLCEARTIHRLLEYSMSEGFQRNEENPLECDVLIVDEASMIDTVLMYHLIKALPPQARLVLVGDVDQLPSVGPGVVLGDIIASGAVPVVKLEEIYRQETTSQIIVNAHKINRGIVPEVTPGEKGDDFFFIRREEPQDVHDLVLEMVRTKIPQAFGLDAMDDIQVITPMHKGEVGVENLNLHLQEALNPHGERIDLGKRTLRIDDKVMQLRNDYGREVYNGDIGRISGVDRAGQVLQVSFDGRGVEYEFSDLDELALAYAITVHKAQGSEYPAVVMPLLPQHYMLLQRNLVYTGITRGTRLVVMIGAPRALSMAVRNDRPQRRYTRLGERLQGYLGAG